jgi:hypothetical protein
MPSNPEFFAGISIQGILYPEAPFGRLSVSQVCLRNEKTKIKVLNLMLFQGKLSLI